MIHTTKQVIDVCCGGKMFYFDKHDSRVLFCDERRFTTKIWNDKTFSVKPDLLVDFKVLPFESDSFSLVIFDPPHIKYGSQKSVMVKKYGKLSPHWRDDLAQGFEECWRVLRANGTLIFKWSEGQIALSEILKCFKQKPLIAQRTSKTSHFCVFFKDERRD